MSSLSAVLGWYGPYHDLASARRSANNDNFKDYLYVVFGYGTFRTRGRPTLLYIGVGSRGSNRLSNSHSAIGVGSGVTITSIWLGEVDSQRRAGRRLKKREPIIDQVEGAMIALLSPRINMRRKSFPSDSLAIINRWWSNIDWETPATKPIAIWPDLIECAGGHAPVHLCWLRTKKIKTIRRPPA